MRSVIDDEEEKLLSIDDVKALIKIKDLYYERRDIELKEVFFKGGSNAFYFFQSIDILDKKEENMKNLNETFLEAYKDYFGEYFSNVMAELRQNNKEYQSLIKNKENILNEFPRLREVLEDKNTYSLSEEEIGGLVKYLDINGDQQILEEIELIYRGMQEAYVLFKKINVIKD